MRSILNKISFLFKPILEVVILFSLLMPKIALAGFWGGDANIEVGLISLCEFFEEGRLGPYSNGDVSRDELVQLCEDVMEGSDGILNQRNNIMYDYINYAKGNSDGYDPIADFYISGGEALKYIVSHWNVDINRKMIEQIDQEVDENIFGRACRLSSFKKDDMTAEDAFRNAVKYMSEGLDIQHDPLYSLDIDDQCSGGWSCFWDTDTNYWYYFGDIYRPTWAKDLICSDGAYLYAKISTRPCDVVADIEEKIPTYAYLKTVDGECYAFREFDIRQKINEDHESVGSRFDISELNYLYMSERDHEVNEDGEKVNYSNIPADIFPYGGLTREPRYNFGGMTDIDGDGEEEEIEWQYAIKKKLIIDVSVEITEPVKIETGNHYAYTIEGYDRDDEEDGPEFGFINKVPPVLSAGLPIIDIDNEGRSEIYLEIKNLYFRDFFRNFIVNRGHKLILEGNDFSLSPEFTDEISFDTPPFDGEDLVTSKTDVLSIGSNWDVINNRFFGYGKMDATYTPRKSMLYNNEFYLFDGDRDKVEIEILDDTRLGVINNISNKSGATTNIISSFKSPNKYSFEGVELDYCEVVENEDGNNANSCVSGKTFIGEGMVHRMKFHRGINTRALRVIEFYRGDNLLARACDRSDPSTIESRFAEDGEYDYFIRGTNLKCDEDIYLFDLGQGEFEVVYQGLKRFCSNHTDIDNPDCSQLTAIFYKKDGSIYNNKFVSPSSIDIALIITDGGLNINIDEISPAGNLDAAIQEADQRFYDNYWNPINEEHETVMGKLGSLDISANGESVARMVERHCAEYVVPFFEDICTRSDDNSLSSLPGYIKFFMSTHGRCKKLYSLEHGDAVKWCIYDEGCHILDNWFDSSDSNHYSCEKFDQIQNDIYGVGLMRRDVWVKPIRREVSGRKEIYDYCKRQFCEDQEDRSCTGDLSRDNFAEPSEDVKTCMLVNTCLEWDGGRLTNRECYSVDSSGNPECFPSLVKPVIYEDIFGDGKKLYDTEALCSDLKFFIYEDSPYVRDNELLEKADYIIPEINYSYNPSEETDSDHRCNQYEEWNYSEGRCVELECVENGSPKLHWDVRGEKCIRISCSTDTQYIVNNQCDPCPEGSKIVNGDWSQCLPIECADDEEVAGYVCRKLECPIGEEPKNHECVPVDCGDEGWHFEGGQCVPDGRGPVECREGWHPEDGICVEDDPEGMDCPNGYHEEDGVCVEDDAGGCDEGWHLEDGVCVEDDHPIECDDGYHLEEGECVEDEHPIECDDGYHLEDDACVPDDETDCKKGEIYFDAECREVTTSADCDDNELLLDGEGCVAMSLICGDGMWDGTSCVQVGCPSGYNLVDTECIKDTKGSGGCSLTTSSGSNHTNIISFLGLIFIIGIIRRRFSRVST